MSELNGFDKKSVVDKLKAAYAGCYDITVSPVEGEEELVLLGEYYEHAQKYVMSRKAELWSADCEEFLYLFSVEHLTEEKVRQCIGLAYEDGRKRAHIGAGHMYTYITPVFVCDRIDADAVKTIKRCNIYKSFKFGFHGWLDVHVAAFTFAGNDYRFYTNKSGKCLVKSLKKVL